MISRLSVVLLLFGMVSCSSLKCQKNYSNIIYDIKGLPLLNCKPNKLSHIDSCIYIKTNGEKIPVDFNIRYQGGGDSLAALCERQYFLIVGQEFQELNEKVQYVILFDKDQRINEIRLSKKSTYLDSKYDTIIKTVLLKTDGYWQKENCEINNWSFYIGWFYLQ